MLISYLLFFFFLIYMECPGQLTRTTTIPHGPLDILQAQEQVRHNFSFLDFIKKLQAVVYLNEENKSIISPRGPSVQPFISSGRGVYLLDWEQPSGLSSGTEGSKLMARHSCPLSGIAGCLKGLFSFTFFID